MKKIIPLLLAISLIGYGCASVGQSVSVDNFSGHKVTDFNLKTTSGGFDFEYGNLIPNAHSRIGQAGYTGPMKIKPNDTCEATWVDELGQKHEVKIDLNKQSGLGFHPDLLFIINQDGNTMTVKRLKE